jgi:AcrR family transcriptional regulator
MPRTEAQFGEMRDQKIILIMDTALELFANEGYYPTSISKISQQAGISKGLIYNYFESKEDLIHAIIGKGIKKLAESIDPNKDGFLTSEEFEFHVNETFRILQENTEYWKLFYSAMMQPAVYKLAIGKYSDMHTQMKALFEDYFMRKGLPDPKAEAYFFDLVLDGIFVNYVMNPNDFPLEKLKNMVIERFR